MPALDGLRVLAFLGVWLCHIASYSTTVLAHPRVFAVLSTGAFGVPLFFVLSAFLITRLLLMERERNGKVDLKAYYVRRTLRIWPLYFLVMAVGLFVAWHLGQPIHGQTIALATFTANWFHGRGLDIPTPLGPLWSVSVEEQFYLVWPFVLSLLNRRGLHYLCYGMVATALVARCVLVRHDHTWVTMWISTTSHLDSLALGTLLALNFDRLRAFSRAQGTGLMALCVAAMVAINTSFPFFGAMGLTKAAVAYTAVPFLCAAIVAIAIQTRGIFLGRPRIAAFGRLTYGMYMWHMMPLILFVPHAALPLVACLLGTIAIATLSYYAYERPFLSLKHRFERVRTRPA